MRFNIKRILVICLVAVVGVASLLAASAASVVLRVSPASGTYVKGSTFNSDVLLDTDTIINYVRAEIYFNPGLLEVVSVSTSGSSFDSGPEPLIYGAYGYVRVERNDASWVQGNGLKVATITFRAKEVGSATVMMLASSQASYPQNGANQITSRQGATYEITSTTPPPVTPPVNPTPTPTPTPTPSPPRPPITSRPLEPQNPQEPVINTITAKDVTLKYFRGDGSPIADADVLVGDKALKTDGNGSVAVQLPPGSYEVTFQNNNMTDRYSFDVADATGSQEFRFYQTSSSQGFEDLPGGEEKTGIAPIKIIGIALGGLVGLVVLGFAALKLSKLLRGKKLNFLPMASSNQEERLIKIGHGVVEGIVYGVRHPAAVKHIQEEIEEAHEKEAAAATVDTPAKQSDEKQRHDEAEQNDTAEYQQKPPHKSKKVQPKRHGADISESAKGADANVHYPGHAVTLDEPEPEDMFDAIDKDEK